MSRAIFTMMHNEQFFLPMWIKYYSQFFKPEDMYILAHNCTGKTNEILEQAKKDGINVQRFDTDEIFNHDWLLTNIHFTQRKLLEKYDYVVFTDCDEILVPVNGTLGEFLDNATEDAYRAKGHDVIEDKMYLSHGFNKTLISKIPLTWCHGYHTSLPEFKVNDDLHLYHLHKLNYKECFERNIRLSQETWDKFAVDNRLGAQNLISEEKDFKKMFYDTGDLTEQDKPLKQLLDYIQ